MIQTTNEAEKRLIGVLTQQKAIYEAVIPVAEEVAAQMEIGKFPQPEFETMNQGLTQIKILDQQADKDRDLVTPENISTGSVLPMLRQDVESLVQKLLTLTNQLESKIKNAKEQLNPQLSQHVVASKMSKAYGGTQIRQ